MFNEANQHPPSKAALSVTEFCGVIGLSRSKFYEEVGEGRIQVLKMGSRTIVPVAQIDAYLAQLQFKGGRR